MVIFSKKLWDDITFVSLWFLLEVPDSRKGDMDIWRYEMRTFAALVKVDKDSWVHDVLNEFLASNVRS